jgi:hypothetical protein
MATHRLYDPRLAPSHKHDALVAVARVVDFLFGLLYLLLGIRLVLDFFAARPGAGFVQFIHGLSAPFYGPFQGIVGSDVVEGGHPLVWPLVVAIVAYGILHAIVRGVLRLVDAA